MGSRPRPLVAGNWKMNGLFAALDEAEAIARGVSPALARRLDLLLCPPATLIHAMRARVGEAPVAIGAQDCHTGVVGPHTGDISAAMLRDAGASFVIVGHSERRADHGESDELVRRKAEAALVAGLTPIVCVGETLSQRQGGDALHVVDAQLEGSIPRAPGALVVAYEPVWAIGSGLTPTVDDVAAMHRRMRQTLARIIGPAAAATPLLYGGSVKPSNAAALVRAPEVDGALVGGASLIAAEFLAIVAAYEDAPAEAGL